MIEVNELKALGLSETEAKTYLALLELGSGTVTSITHRAGITRTLGYHSLDHLIELGLIEQKNNSHPVEFHVKHPKKIFEYLEKEKTVWINRIEHAKNLLPKLESSYTMLQHPFLSQRIGKESVLELYRTLYTNSTLTISLLNPTLADPEILRALLTIKSHLNTKNSICCVFDTPEARNTLSTISDHSLFRWIPVSNVHIDVYKSIETIVTYDTLYTMSDKNGELYMDNITHEATVKGMYTLLYTIINS